MNVQLKSKFFLSSPEVNGVFGDGKYRLLKTIAEEGSIQKAADKLDRSYRKAWGDIKRSEVALGRPLVVKSRGGASGGSTTLTPFGFEVLAAWEAFHADIKETLESSYAEHLKALLETNEA